MKYWKRAHLIPGVVATIVLISAAADFDLPLKGDAGKMADAMKGSIAGVVTYAGQNAFDNSNTNPNEKDIIYNDNLDRMAAGNGEETGNASDGGEAGNAENGEAAGNAKNTGKQLASAVRNSDPFENLVAGISAVNPRTAARYSVQTLGLGIDGAMPVDSNMLSESMSLTGNDISGSVAPEDGEVPGGTDTVSNPKENSDGLDADQIGEDGLDGENAADGNTEGENNPADGNAEGENAPEDGDIEGENAPEDGNAEDENAPEEDGDAEGEDGQEEGPAPQFYSLGVSHSTVADIQQRLMDLGFMDYAEPTEYYGSITERAVKLFQRQNDLNQDGIIGPLTMEMLFAEDANYYLAKLGMSGDDIKLIQQRLYEMGYLAKAENVTGYFGDLTEEAVKEMQRNNGLAADGKVGQMTIEMLYSEDAKANIMSFGDKSDIVKGFQERLRELGYLTTAPDGLYGNDTVAAVKLFQSRNDLVVDGYLGPSTLEVLGSSTAVPNGLILGDSGDTVKRVQQLLARYGYMSSDNCTGYFGEITEQAVKNFQKNNGLSADGNVGMKTMAVLTGGNARKANGSTGSSGSAGSSGTGSSGSTGSSGNTGSSNNGNSSGNNKASASVSSLLAAAKSKLGCPYVYGAKGPNAFDCSGYVYWCLNQIGIKQSYITSYGWRTVGKYQKITSFSSIKAGDIVVVKGHVGIAAGNGMVYDASSSSGKIVYRSLGDWWRKNFIVAWRIF